MPGRKSNRWICLMIIGLLGLCSCSSPSSNLKEEKAEQTQQTLVYEKTMELKYAENFQVDYYEGGYTMLLLPMEHTKFLVVPEGMEEPSGLEKDIIVLNRPIQNLYVVASSVMDMFQELDSLDTIAFSGQKEENWYIEGAKKAMQEGKMQYAGKYNQPDYERIVSGNCSLAIENMMISHAPEVKEKLNEFGIPVMIERSSYETHPLGRVEWVKFFGALLGKEKEAEQIFQKQEEILRKVTGEEKTGKTVAFFFVTSNGMIQVRQSNDYIPKMIELAGGTYVFSDLGEDSTKRSTINMQVEEFYNGAKDADFLIYNSSIDGGVKNLEQLLEKCDVLKDFKAVKEGNVWCTTNNMYQQSLSIGYLMEDIYKMLREKESQMQYLYPLR